MSAPSRQSRRLSRLAGQGVRQVNVMVHDDCRPALDRIRPYLARKGAAEALVDWMTQIPDEKPVNVGSVRHLSPFRYPGGKTWLVPRTREWLNLTGRRGLLVEPFAGGAMVGLSAAAEDLVDRVHLVELDGDVAAVWELIFNSSDWQVDQLCRSIATFEITKPNVEEIIASDPRSLHKKAFRTIVKNRCQRGGIMAPGAGLTKEGENGKGLASRWYPDTLQSRIRTLRQLVGRVTFERADALDVIERSPDDAVLFIDPPYTAAGKRAGSRLYTHNDLDHERLFDLVAAHKGPALMTYDDTAAVRELAAERNFYVGDIAMKSTHHAVMRELTIYKDPPFYAS